MPNAANFPVGPRWINTDIPLISTEELPPTCGVHSMITGSVLGNCVSVCSAHQPSAGQLSWNPLP